MRLPLIAGLLLTLLPSTALSEEDAMARSRDLYRQAIEAYKAGDYPGMMEALDGAVALRPHHPTLIYNLAAAQALAREPERSIDTLKRLAEMGILVDPAGDEDFKSIKERESFMRVVEQLGRNGYQVGTSELAFTFPEFQFIPESVAYSPADDAFFVGSVYRREIFQIKGGKASPYANRLSGLWSVFGMKVDAQRNFLWVCTTACENTQDLISDDLGKVALVAFDLSTGKVRQSLSPLPDEKPFWFGDLCLSKNGDVYVSDSIRGEIYLKRADVDSLELFAADPQFASLQGLTLSADERFLFVADYSHGVFRVELDTRAVELLEYSRNATLLGIDGLYVFDGDLLAIQNGIRPHRIARVRLAKDAKAIEAVDVLAANDPNWDEPTLGMILETDFYYVGNSQWGLFQRDGSLPDTVTTQEPKVFKISLTSQ